MIRWFFVYLLNAILLIPLSWSLLNVTGVFLALQYNSKPIAINDNNTTMITIIIAVIIIFVVDFPVFTLCNNSSDLRIKAKL